MHKSCMYITLCLACCCNCMCLLCKFCTNTGSIIVEALLAETERLSQDRLDLQRQAEKDHSSLSQRLRALERELEEQETRGLETELQHKTDSEDLSQRVQALEKQLKHDRQFIEVS